MDAELRAHIEACADDLLRTGISRAEALRRARIEFGGLERVKEECRESRGVHLVETLLQDIRFAFRMLRKSPGFTAVAVLTLALGIGANTTILSIISGMILRRPPVHDPNNLLVITSKNPANVFAADRFPVSAADYLDWCAQADDFNGMAAAHYDDFTISGSGLSPEFVSGARVSANFFQVMEAHAALGRMILPDEDQPGKDQAVVISAQLWKGEFAGDPHILGRRIKINGNSHTIVGVMPEDFSLYDSPSQVWFPLIFSSDELAAGRRSFRFLRVFARLKPGVRVSEAATQMNAIAERLARAYPDTNKNWGARVMTDQQYVISDWNASRPLSLLMCAVGFVLLIACANVASMLLARNASRSQEFSIRTVLGAGKLRLARQLFTECLLLSVAGAALGILFAYGGIRAVAAQFNWNPAVVAFGKTIGIDVRVLTLTAAISIVVALLIGIAPAARFARGDFAGRLKGAGRGLTAGHERHRLQRVLVTGQIALSLILLTGAGLFVEDFVAEIRAATGLDPRNVLTASISLRGSDDYNAPQRQVSFFRESLRKIEQSPEAESVSATSTLPFDFPNQIHFVIDGHPAPRPADLPSSDYTVVSPGYFHTLRIPLLQGREFAASDGPNSAPVAIIDTALARRYFPGENPVGQHLRIAKKNRPQDQWIEVIGVVGHVDDFLGERTPRPHLFEPFLAHPANEMSFVVRARTEATAFASSLRRAIWAVDANQAINSVRTMDRVIADSSQGDNIMAEWMGVFAVIALMMAAMGIYGVLSYLVAQRTHEIGIRMALGAERRSVLRLVMRNGAVLIAVGAGAGCCASILLPRVVGAVISGLGVHQWWMLIAGTTITVLSVALLACYIPARRAMKVDPMVALRHE